MQGWVTGGIYQNCTFERQNMENLYRLINIETGKKDMICLVGAGGKTSAMFRLASELSAKGKKVLATTTTAIYYPEGEQYDEILITEKESLDLFYNRSGSGITVLGRSISSDGKLLGVNPEFLDALFCEEIFDYILVEGDGSKGRPVKAPARHEPVIPSCTTKVLGLIGLDSIGKKICREYVHRPELFCSISGCQEGDIIDSDIISKLIAHKEGLFKAAPAFAEKYIILNKAEGESRRIAAYGILHKLSDMGYKPAGMVISSMKDSRFRNAVRMISGIILASGFSRRMGADKLLLPIGGIPVIERVIAAASKSSLGEVVLVCANGSVASIGRKYGAKIVENNAPEQGQSHSIRLGVENSGLSADGYMFLVGDQPFINESTINRLIDGFTMGSSSAAVPMYNGVRGNPVIFASSHKDELLHLSGDSGGRVLLEKLKGNIITVCFADGNLGLDIDTREDYEKVVKLEDENE